MVRFPLGLEVGGCWQISKKSTTKNLQIVLFWDEEFPQKTRKPQLGLITKNAFFLEIKQIMF